MAPVKPSSAAVASGSSGRDDPLSAPAPSGEYAARGVPVAQPVEVARQSVHVLGQLVPERDRLGVLQVREAGDGVAACRSA